MAGRVIVVGSVNVDLVIVVDRLPGPGETVTGGDVARHHGGKGGNQAVAAARVGGTVELVGAIGIDDFGAAAAEALAVEGVGTSSLTRVERPTGVALIVVDAAGENLIAVAPGANAALGPADVRSALARLEPGPADVLLTVAEIPEASVRAALDAGRRAGATTILNPAPAAGLDGSTLALADVITPNRAELAALATAFGAGTGVAAAGDLAVVARRLIGEGGGRAAIVTLGAAGAIVVTADGDSVPLPAATVASVDATGAGDTFNGVLAAGIADGRPVLEAARRAVIAAGISTTRPGARGGMPTLAEIEAFETSTD